MIEELIYEGIAKLFDRLNVGQLHSLGGGGDDEDNDVDQHYS